nr:unnamed protein product [Callosobruchus analis]
MTDTIVKKLQKSLKLSGFSVRREFCERIVTEFLASGINLEENEAFEEIIKKLCVCLEDQCLIDQSIEKQHIERVIEVCLRSGYDQNETVFNVMNAFDFPKLYYNLDRKLFFLESKSSKLLSDANTKAKLFLDRYYTVLQRTRRSFQQKSLGQESLKLQTVDYLLTLSYATLDHTLVLGSLIQASEGKYYLEDATGMVELDLVHAKYHLGFFVENCFVLVNGFYEDKVLHVSTVVLPPSEDFANSRPSFPNLNYFGGSSSALLRESVRLKEYLHANENKIMLFFSDVWLDQPVVLQKLQILFEGLQDMPPIAFVFMGNFMSTMHGGNVIDTLKRQLKKLTDVILKFPEIANNSNFVFVPGLSDPCTAHMVPRLALPKYLTDQVKNVLPKAVFATNPCRIQYCTREITVFRADLLCKFLQSTLYKPSKDDIIDCLTKTIISQGHLSPLPLNSLTVHWDFDYCMRLYPLPDLVVIGDKSEAYQGHFKGCRVINPGAFCEGGFQFKAYTPFTNEVDDCDLESVSE